MLLVTLRWAIVLLILALIARQALIRDWPVLRANLGLLFMLGALGFTGFNALYYLAAHTTSALNLGIVQGTMPALVLVGSMVVYQTKIKPLQALGVCLTPVGVLVVVSQGSFDTLLQFAFKQGDLLVLVACILYAGYTLWLRKRPDVDPLSLFGVMAVAAFLTSLPIAAFEAATGSMQLPTMQGWMIVTLVALLPSLLAQSLFIYGVQAIGPERAATFVNLVPVLAALLAVYFLGETFALYHGASLAVVLLGIWLSERS